METREQREQLKALSTEIFGKSSRYQSLYEQKELVTRTVVETIPGENGAPDTTKETQVPDLLNGSKRYRIKHNTTEEVLAILLKLKAIQDEYLAKRKQEQELAEQTKKVQDVLTGTALT